MEKEMEISILDILRILLKRLWLIFLCTLVGFSGAFVISMFLIAPRYTSTCQMYVNTNTEDINKDANGNYTELQYAQKLVNSYLVILSNDVFLNNVASASGLNYTAGEIRKMLSLESINNTEFFEVSIESKSSEDSFKLVKTISDLAPDEITRIKETDSVKIVAPATIPVAPSSPNVIKNSIIGAMLGFVIMVAIAILIEFLDTRIKSEEDLANHYSLPILGSVPKYEEE